MSDPSFKDFLDKWITPTTIAIMFGTLVWGVQLNYGLLSLTESDARQSQEIKELSDLVKSMTFNTARQTLILEAIVADLKDHKIIVRDHISMDELWNRRIIKNEMNLKKDKNKNNNRDINTDG